jgi:transposase
MPTTLTHCTTPTPTLYMALELSASEWLLTFATGPGSARRHVPIPARDGARLLAEVVRAKAKLQVPADAPVLSCYEAGRDGFWVHRWLAAQGIANVVVDPASIEVNRRYRRAKTDRLDGSGLVRLLARWHAGERDAWKVCTAPPAAAEDLRQPIRERLELVEERTRLVNRIRGLLAGVGTVVDGPLSAATDLDALRQWDGQRLPVLLRARLARDRQRLALLERHIADLENAERRAARDDATPQVEQARRLLGVKGVGPTTTWLLVRELFGWRERLTAKQTGALAGLCPTPYTSGDSAREQGISKAGSKRVRWAMVELAWGWLHHQPHSALSQWYQRKYGAGGSRHRKVGIVALARKLLAALLRLATTGAVPEGAEVRDWYTKVTGRPRAANA